MQVCSILIVFNIRNQSNVILIMLRMIILVIPLLSIMIVVVIICQKIIIIIKHVSKNIALREKIFCYKNTFGLSVGIRVF